MSNGHKILWRIFRRIRFPEGESGHIVCSEVETTRSYIDFCQDAYSIHFLAAGRGVYVGPHGGQTPLEADMVFQRQDGIQHSTSVDPLYGPWTERFIFLSEPLVQRLKALGLLPLEPALLRPTSGNVFTKVFNALCESIRAYDMDQAYDNDILLCLIQACVQLAKETSAGIAVTTEDANMVARACAVLEEDLLAELSLPDIARELGVNYNTLRKRFSQIQGCSLRAYRVRLRLNRARLLLEGGLLVSEVAEKLAYHSPFAFSSQFKRYVGLSPSVYAERVHKQGGGSLAANISFDGPDSYQ